MGKQLDDKFILVEKMFKIQCFVKFIFYAFFNFLCTKTTLPRS